uniref:G_PROTEIN_RECEP_F1_2 domain-containing protein n=1 Tax=Caenorhabditis tropicalis TaxID=1561998 RepID=A0A1I7U627_9PELO
MSTISDKLSTDQNYFSVPSPPKPTRICGFFGVHKMICSIVIVLILTFSMLFVMAVFRARPKFLLPYIVLNTILFFAYAGAVIGSTITVPDEIREEINGEDRSYKIADIILLRVAFLLFGAFEIFFIYSYIWTYIDCRRLFLFNRR